MIPGLHTDAVTLVAEVIESKDKPSRPWGQVAQSAFVGQPTVGDAGDRGIHRAIVALGRQDVDPDGITTPDQIELLGASSDHLILRTLGGPAAVGDEIRFELNYSALVRAMTSPFVARVFTEQPAEIGHRATVLA